MAREKKYHEQELIGDCLANAVRTAVSLHAREAVEPGLTIMIRRTPTVKILREISESEIFSRSSCNLCEMRVEFLTFDPALEVVDAAAINIHNIVRMPRLCFPIRVEESPALVRDLLSCFLSFFSLKCLSLYDRRERVAADRSTANG